MSRRQYLCQKHDSNGQYSAHLTTKKDNSVTYLHTHTITFLTLAESQHLVLNMTYHGNVANNIILGIKSFIYLVLLTFYILQIYRQKIYKMYSPQSYF